MEFEFAFADESNIDGLALGIMQVRINGQDLISVHDSQYWMMLFLSINMLLDQAQVFLTTPHSKLEFVGVDSSFMLLFEKIAPDSVAIFFEQDMIAQLHQDELIQILWAAVDKFSQKYEKLLPSDDLAKDDFVLAMQLFYDTFEEIING